MAGASGKLEAEQANKNLINEIKNKSEALEKRVEDKNEAAFKNAVKHRVDDIKINSEIESAGIKAVSDIEVEAHKAANKAAKDFDKA